MLQKCRSFDKGKSPERVRRKATGLSLREQHRDRVAGLPGGHSIFLLCGAKWSSYRRCCHGFER